MSVEASGRNVLVVAPHIPEPGGTCFDQALLRLLAALGQRGSVHCLAESPPLSTRLAEADLARRGVRLIRPPRPLDAQVRVAFRETGFSGCVVAGAGCAERWLKTLRTTGPRLALACFLPDSARLLGRIEALPASRRALERAAWRERLSLADAVWLDAPGDLERFKEGLWPVRSALSCAPGSGELPLRRTGGPLRAEVLLMDHPTGDAAALRVAARMAFGAAPRPVAVEDARTFNAALRRSRAEFVLFCRHPVSPAEQVLAALAAWLRTLPYAGGMAPSTDAAARWTRGRPALGRPQLSALWSLKFKWAWHQVDFLTHACCLLLRRSALEAAGGMDERFRGMDAAWLDCFLRMQLAGFPLFLAQDALAFCKAGRGLAAGSPDQDLLIAKWSCLSLRFMESLAMASEPRGYRSGSAGPAQGGLLR